MHKFPIFNYERMEELPLEDFDKLPFAIYLVDLDWNYLFANQYAFKVHNEERNDLAGKNLWSMLKERMDVDDDFKTFINRIQKGNPANVTTISAISNKRVSVTGYALQDCYYFAVTILPNKDNLMNELRAELNKGKNR